MAQWAGKVDIHACRSLSSGCQEASFWSENGFRNNFMISKFTKFSGGGAASAKCEAHEAQIFNMLQT